MTYENRHKTTPKLFESSHPSFSALSPLIKKRLATIYLGNTFKANDKPPIRGMSALGRAVHPPKGVWPATASIPENLQMIVPDNMTAVTVACPKITTDSRSGQFGLNQREKLTNGRHG
jgi:hypothetical protein